MAGCLDHCQPCGCGGYFTCLERCLANVAEWRNPVASYTAGVFFAIGWWLVIDAAVNLGIVPAHWTCGVFSTLALFMINAISSGAVSGDGYGEGCCNTTGARVWMFFGFLMAFGGVISSCWLLIADYAKNPALEVDAGVLLFLQNVFIFVSTMIFKFGRSEEVY